jgi:hypothetical protein
MLGATSHRNSSVRPTHLVLNLHSEKLRRLVGSLSLRADLSYPREARWRLLVEAVDLVAAHSFLGHYHLLTSVDDEVASLVKPTVFTIFHSLVLIQIFELAELRAEHDRNFADENSLCRLFEDYFLDFALPSASFRIIYEEIVKDLLAVVDISVNFSRISQVPHTGMVREDWCHSVVFFSNPRLAVDVYLSELDFVNHILVVSAGP